MAIKRFSPVVGDWVVPKTYLRRVGAGVDRANPTAHWENIQWIKEKVNGNWVTRYPPIAADLVSQVYSVGAANPDPNAVNICGYRINASGQAELRNQQTYTSVHKWMLGGSASDYYVRASHLTSPDLPQGFSLDVWHPATDSPEWWIEGTVNAPGDTYLRIDIATLGTDASMTDSGGAAITDSSGSPLFLAGPVYEVLDGANIGLRAGKN